MLNYTTFKEAVTRELADHLPENMEVTSGHVEKNNGPVDALFVGKSGSQVRANLYVRDYYDTYLACGDFRRTLEKMIEDADRAVEQIPEAVTVEDFLSAPSVILPELINTQANAERLQNLPHRELCDLSITYRRWFLDDAGNRTGYTCVIDNAQINMTGQTEEDLYKTAMDADFKYNEPVVEDLTTCLYNVLKKDGMPEDMAKAFLSEEAPPIYIITNQTGRDGASMMLRKDALDKAAALTGGDCYILPSSAHELLAVPADAVKKQALTDIVAEVNGKSVTQADRLSNGVYYYSAKTKELSQAQAGKNLKTTKNLQKGAR